MANPLTILLGADSLLGARSGVGRMTWQIARALRCHDEVAGLRLLAGSRSFGPDLLDMPGAAGSAARATGLRDRLGRVPAAQIVRAAWVRRRMDREAARVAGPVVYHEPNLVARPFSGTTVVTVNDLSWRVAGVFHPRARIDWIERRLPATIAQATRFVAISAFTAGEMVAQLGIARERIDVVPLAPAAQFRPLPLADATATLAALGLEAGGFILSVSTLEPRKNFDRLLAAHALLPDRLRQHHPLAIAGGQGWGEALGDERAQLALRAGHLRLLGHLPDEQLVALYAHCSLFAFPSLYEGFGLPVIEAMACGAPVLASATTAVGETAGDAALLVDPENVEAIAGGLRTALEDCDASRSLRERGQARAATFRWERTIALLLASWRRALAS